MALPYICLQYTVENQSALAEGVEAAEKWAIAEVMVDQQKMKEKDEAAGLQLLGPPLPGFTHSLHIYMEVAEYYYFQ